MSIRRTCKSLRESDSLASRLVKNSEDQRELGMEAEYSDPYLLMDIFPSLGQRIYPNIN